MTSLVAGASLLADLDRLGYAVVPLLDADEVASLRADFEACHPQAGTGFETDFERDDARFKAGVAERTAWVWERAASHVPGYELFMASYLVKWPTPDSHLALHADWSYVDEDVHPSYAVWVPLVDTGPGIDNGPLAVVPGSHRLVRSWRGTSTPAWYESGHDGFVEAAVVVTAPAGCAVVFDNRLLHHSPPNHGRVPRPVLAGAFAPVGAQLLHVVGDGGPTAQVIEVDARFFRERNPSGLRAERPAVPEGARVVDLVTGAYDPVALAADHGLDDASGFAPGAGRRWPDTAHPLPVSDVRALLAPRLDLAALPWAPAQVDAAPDAAIHLPIVVDGRCTPVGEGLLGGTDPGGWASLDLVRVAPEAEVHLGSPAVAGPGEVALVGAIDGDLSVLVVGTAGWTTLSGADVAPLPEAATVRNRSDHAVAVLVGHRAPDPRAGRVRRWFDRRRPAPPAWQLAVELTEAVS